MRKLATIRKVDKIYPIVKSDFLELISFTDIGWQCVARKGEFKEGDVGVYFEVDSFLPVHEEFEFLRKSSFRKLFTGREGFRLRTMKLRGTLSQGLFLPLNKFIETLDCYMYKPDLHIGQDVSTALCVTKWKRAPSVSMQGDIVADYPAHTNKSNQDRIQNCLEYFEKYKGIAFERTMKFEGTSVSYHFHDGEFSASSHNTTYANNEKFKPFKMADELGLDLLMKHVNRNVTIQGEFMGPKIQETLKILNLMSFMFIIYGILIKANFYYL